MKPMNSLLAQALLLALAGTSPAMAASAEDEALFKACPGLQAWADSHPRQQEPPERAKADAIGMPGLLVELQRREAEDQRAREHMFDTDGTLSKAGMEAMAAVDADNLLWLRKTIADTGFPTREQVGEQGVALAFTLVQHADADPKFQQSVLEAVRPRLANSGIRKSQFAMLTDRVLVAQGKPQRYGSQYDRAADGSFTLKATEDLPGLDERRQQMDLMPTRLYECVLQASYAAQ